MHFQREHLIEKRLPHYVCADCFSIKNLASVHFYRLKKTRLNFNHL